MNRSPVPARQALTLARKALGDLRRPAYPVEPAEIPADGRGAYPLDLRPLGSAFHLDTEGVVVAEGSDGLAYRNPVSACLYALGRHTEARQTTTVGRDSATLDSATVEHALAGLLAQARHLRQSQDPEGGWRYPVPVSRYRVRTGWYSGMAQGLAISVMLRAADQTGEQSYLDAAAAASCLLLRPISAGGCADYDMLGRPFLEECPSDPPSHILNGAVFALIGLRELNGRTGAADFRPAVRRLADQLPDFDLGYWSRYDLWFAAPASNAYHCLHISLLRASGRAFGDSRFDDIADRWRHYLNRPGCRVRAMAGKARFVLSERHE